MHLLSCEHHDDALLQSAAVAAAACAGHTRQRELLHAHGIERIVVAILSRGAEGHRPATLTALSLLLTRMFGCDV